MKYGIWILFTDDESFSCSEFKSYIRNVSSCSLGFMRDIDSKHLEKKDKDKKGKDGGKKEGDGKGGNKDEKDKKVGEGDKDKKAEEKKKWSNSD